MVVLAGLRRLWTGSGARRASRRRAAALTAAADAARDVGDCMRAAEAYGAVAALLPDRLDLRVQQANMLKDAGRLTEAERAYRAVLERDPRNADAHLQLGHMLKRAGRAAEALEAYETALSLDPGCEGARRELVEAGRWRAQAARAEAVARGEAVDPTAALVLEIEALSRRLDALRAALPEAARLRHVPAALYPLWRERCAAPMPPPAPEGAPRIAILLDGARSDAAAAERLVAAAQAQRDPAWTLLAFGSGAEAAARRAAVADPRVRWTPDLDPAAFGPDDWALLLEQEAEPHPDAVGWLRWAAATGRAQALVADFERMEGGAPVEGRLRGVPDPDALLAGADWPEAIALPALLLAAAPSGDEAPAFERAADALLRLAEDGRAGHIPAPLARGAGPDAGARAAAAAARTARALAARAPGVAAAPSTRHPGVLRVEWPAPAARIEVIIPTRDNGPDLEALVDSLLTLAARPALLRITVLDNGGGMAGAALARVAARGAQVRDAPGPFHWTAMNAEAAARSDADLLVFANDDMRMLSAGWDARLAAQLARPGIGVVGARLLYPDGAVQHAGVLTGWRGGVIHDGLVAPAEDFGPGRRWRAPRRASAIDGAFLATSRALFERLGGFELRLAICFSDVDYCLRARAAGLAALYDPEIELIHHESRSRGQETGDPARVARADAEMALLTARWGAALAQDPSANPHYADFGRPFQHLALPSRARLEAHARLACSGAPWAATAAQGV